MWRVERRHRAQEPERRGCGGARGWKWRSRVRLGIARAVQRIRQLMEGDDSETGSSSSSLVVVVAVVLLDLEWRGCSSLLLRFYFILFCLLNSYYNFNFLFILFFFIFFIFFHFSGRLQGWPGILDLGCEFLQVVLLGLPEKMEFLLHTGLGPWTTSHGYVR